MSDLKKTKRIPLFGLMVLCLAAFAPDKEPTQKAAPVDPHANVDQLSVDAERQFHLALGELRADNKEAAKKRLDIGLAKYPDNYKMLSLRANIKLMSRQFFEALADLNKVIRLQPGEAGLLVNRSLVYRSLKKYQQAMKDLNKAVELNPQLYSAIFNRGTLHYGQAQIKEASNDFKRCIELAPTDPRPRHNLALSLHKMGQRSQAIAALEALKKNTDDRHWRGVAAKQIRDWNNPEKLQEAAKKAVPNPHAKPGDNKAR